MASVAMDEQTGEKETARTLERRKMRLYSGIRMPDAPCPANAEKIDMAAMPMILKMAERGLRVDLDHFSKWDVMLTRDMDRITENVRSATGYYINCGSGDQVSDLLFKKLGLKQARVKMTQSGYRESVEDEVLTAIQHDHPVVPMLLTYKEYEKLRGTYVRPMPKLARRTAFGLWRMFPNFRTTRVPSGRLSCADPNLLAMPVRTDRGKEIRKGFITDAGWRYVSVDLSQIEMRVAAHRSQDYGLMSIYRNKEDIYSDFATTAFKLEDKRYKNPDGKWVYPTVDAMQHRYPAKTCILASMYRVTGKGLLNQMPVLCVSCGKESSLHTCGRFSPMWTENRCQDLINNFYLKYSGLTNMQHRDDIYVRRHAMIHDMWGRILHVAAARSVLEWVVSSALREAGNFPIQSGAQGIIKIAMAALSDDIDNGLNDVVHELLQVHDELVFECREDVAEELGELAKVRMETAVPLTVPIKASMSIANTWGDLDK
jgi:DNA polymerase I